jgi:hypothetical protein
VITGTCTVYELRRYTLRPETFDEFVQLFETHLLDTQDAVGMQVVGQFRDLDRPDAFVWIRAFTDMERRREALTAFYYGPVWAQHAKAANAMMIDSDDVLLLEPADGRPGLAEQVGPRPPLGSALDGSAEFEVLICASDRNRERPSGGHTLPTLRTLHTPNTFPQLPVHEDRDVVVTLTRLADAAHRSSAGALDPTAQRLRLRPTPRSALR